MASEDPLSGLTGPQPCRETEARSCEDKASDPVAPPLEVKPVTEALPVKTNVWQDLLHGVGDATGKAVAAVGAALGSIGAALGGVLRAYAELLASLRPPGANRVAFDASVSVASGAAAFTLQFGSRMALRRLLPFLPAIPGFSRIAKDELLEHERRARIYDMIKENPGIRLADLARGLDLAWGTAMHHLRKLRADRLIMIQRIGSHPAYFINGSGLNQEQMAAAALVQGKTVEGVAGYIGAHPKTTLKELAAGLGISSPLAAFHVSKLEKAGLVQKVRDGRAVRIVPAASLCPPTSAVTAAFGGGAVPTAA